MFDKLDDLLIRFEELMSELQEPDVANDQNRFRKLMKEQSDLAPIVEAYNEYKSAKQAITDSEEMLEMESDEEMRELAKEELSSSKKRVEELEHELKILLLPKDPNDDKNIMVEIRAGAGGDEQNEEIYAVLSGRGTMVVDGETVELQAGDWLRVAPAGERQLSAAADSAISVICIQVKAGSLEGFTMTDGVVK